MTTIITATTFDQLILPERLYKYRNWYNEEYRRILTHSEVLFASPADFNDHRECNLERDYDSVTEDTLFNYFKRTLPESTSDQVCRAMAQQRMQAVPLFSQEQRNEASRILKTRMNAELSIFSTSAHRNKLSLWETFAAYHEGFCVGLNTRILFDNEEMFSSGGEMMYYDPRNPPKIRAICNNENEMKADMAQVIFSLPNNYAPECEYRLAKTRLENKRVSINPNAIEEIILGQNISDEHKNEITTIASSQYPNARILIANYNESFDSFSFT